MNRKLFAAVSLVASSVLHASVALAASPTVPLFSAPKAEPSRGYPVCRSSQVRGLPSRAAFETDQPLFQMQAILSAQDHLEEPKPDKGVERLYRNFQVDDFSPVWLPHIVYGGAFADGRKLWEIITYQGTTAPSLTEFVARFRTELGFRDGDWPVRIGNRVYRQYANGARSLGYVHAVGSEHFGGTCFGGGGHGPGFYSNLPATEDGLSAPPDITGSEALAIVHDMNPYLRFLAVEEPGQSLSARLLVLRTHTREPRLAWEARYSFSCWNTGHGDIVPKLSSDSAYVYVDARNGSLVFGRDTERKGGVP
jgi:hypothetical protein